MINEQNEQLKQIRENRRIWYGGKGQLTSDFDFLLSLVAVRQDHYFKPTLVRDSCAKCGKGTSEHPGHDQVATSMRSACIEKVKEVAKAHRVMAEKLKGKAIGEMQLIRAEECDILAKSLESITIQEQKS